MSTFTGPKFKGAAKVAKDIRREEAEERNSRTPVERTRQYRRDRIAKGLAVSA